MLIAVVVTVALSALGLGVLAVGLLEAQSARSGLAFRQAGCAAEAGLEAVKHWFDAPAASAGAWMVPLTSDVDLSLRRVDPEGDGTFAASGTAPAPWNTLYREGRDDLWERPYSGNPRLSLEGDGSGPDVSIAWERGAAQRAFLARLSTALFPDPLAPNLTVRLVRIAVYGPPRVRIGPKTTRLGIASLEIEAQVLRGSGVEETIIASARAHGVLQEIPYVASGPLEAGSVEDGSGLDIRWGGVAVRGDLSLGPDPYHATVGGWPWVSPGRRLISDADLDGSSDDVDGDGTADIDEWLALPDGTLADPWLRWTVGGTIAHSPAGAQPFPFDPSLIPGAFATDDDRSALFQGDTIVHSSFDATVLREATRRGGYAFHLLRYVLGSSPPLYREGGAGAMSFEDVTRGREGLFYFDTIDGRPPRDSDGDGSIDNLTPPVSVSDPDWWTAGFIVLNTQSFDLGRSNRSGSAPVAPPGEPFADIDGDGVCGRTEPFLRLDYPVDPLAPGAGFTRLALTTAAAGSSRREGGPASPAPVTIAGVLSVSGRLAGESSARIFGAVAVSGSLSVARRPGEEPLQILYDERLSRDAWPTPSSRLSRTLWQERSVSP